MDRQKEMAGRLVPAGPGEILRAAEKDESYLTSLQQRLTSLGLETVGPEVWVRTRHLAEPVSRLLYLTITTLSGRQTLGEEYTGLVQVSHNNLPSTTRRLLMIILQTCGPHLLKYLFRQFGNTVKNDPSIRDDAKKKLLTAISYGDTALEFLNKINICLFYFHGTFYHLSKRLTGISYVNYAGSEAEDSTKTSFRLMGYLASFNLLLNILYGAFKLRRVLVQTDPELETGSPSDGGYVRPEERCSLCLDRLGSRGVTTSTPCGHLFCWTCLLESLARTLDCPLCRQKVSPSRIIPCTNYF